MVCKTDVKGRIRKRQIIAISNVFSCAFEFINQMIFAIDEMSVNQMYMIIFEGVLHVHIFLDGYGKTICKRKVAAI